MDDALILRQDGNGITTLTLNRPKARNALSVAMLSALQEQIDQIAKDPHVRVIILAANGPAFCAGHDLKEMRANPSREAYESLFTQCARVMISLAKLPQPVIAKVHATATAAGCQLVATCDLAVAAEEAFFATPGVNIGLFCSTPMVALSRAVGRKSAMRMLLTGDSISAARAYEIGLINEVVALENLDQSVNDLAKLVASKSPYTLAIGKEAFYKQIEMNLEEAYAYASQVMTTNMLSADAADGIDSFINKRPSPVWRGC